MRARSLLLSLVVIAAAGGGYYYYSQHKPADATADAGKGGGAKGGPGGQGGGVQVVKTTLAQKKSVSVTVQANGYVTAINTVDVRPQVQNVVRQIHVAEGQDVKAGQLLFTLDERSDTAARDKAQAQVERDRADLADAESTWKRNQELYAKGFVAQAVVDSAKNKVDSLRGQLAADLAALTGGQVSLGFNRITAGIAGRLGIINVHPGSLAQPSGTALVTIAQLDPISVAFSVPEASLQHIRSSYPNGDAPVTVQLAGGKTLSGKLSFIDNNVDATTGAIKMKAQFANPDKLLWPGAFVNVTLVSHVLNDVIAVPPQAVVTGPTEKFVYLVQEDGSVKRQKVNVGAVEGEIAAITGIAPGAKVVVEGAQNLRANSKVREAAERTAKTEEKGGDPQRAEKSSANKAPAP